MIGYKKIIPMVVALGVFTFGGLSCTKDSQKEPIDVKEYNSVLNQTKGNKELRKQIYEYLESHELYTHVLDTDKHKITVITDSSVSMLAWYQCHDLIVSIKNKYTKDTLKLCDYSVDGNVDVAEYNGVPNGLEGMDERFDKALELVKPGLEQKIKKAEEEKQLLIDRVRENTKLEIDKIKENTKLD